MTPENTLATEAHIHLYRNLGRAHELRGEYEQALAIYEAMENRGVQRANSAIMLAALHPALELVGCTTVNGNVEVLKEGVKLARDEKTWVTVVKVVPEYDEGWKCKVTLPGNFRFKICHLNCWNL